MRKGYTENHFRQPLYVMENEGVFCYKNYYGNELQEGKFSKLKGTLLIYKQSIVVSFCSLNTFCLLKYKVVQ